MRTKLRLLALSALLAMSGHQVGAVETVKSRWLSEPVKVDGAIDDWPTLTSVSKEVAALIELAVPLSPSADYPFSPGLARQ